MNLRKHPEVSSSPGHGIETLRNIYLKQKKAGGMKITFQTPPKNLDEKMLYNILRDYKMLNCEVLVRDENGLSQQLTQLAQNQG